MVPPIVVQVSDLNSKYFVNPSYTASHCHITSSEHDVVNQE